MDGKPVNGWPEWKKKFACACSMNLAVIDRITHKSSAQSPILGKSELTGMPLLP